MKNEIILYSGGIDSTVLLYKHKKSVAQAVSFNYGSNHNHQEIKNAKYHCNKLNIKHKIIDLNFMKDFDSSLLAGADKIPEARDKEHRKSTVVPFRNGIMLSIGAGIAASNNLKTVLIANNSDDQKIYADCRSSFLHYFNQAVGYGTSQKVRIKADFTTNTKAEVIKLGDSLGVELEKTWSCYKGEEKHCGKCEACVKRKKAFQKAGIKDEVEYV